MGHPSGRQILHLCCSSWSASKSGTIVAQSLNSSNSKPLASSLAPRFCTYICCSSLINLGEAVDYLAHSWIFWSRRFTVEYTLLSCPILLKPILVLENRMQMHCEVKVSQLSCTMVSGTQQVMLTFLDVSISNINHTSSLSLNHSGSEN